MTKEEFTIKYGRKSIPLISDERGIRFGEFTPDEQCLSDLNEVIRGELIKFCDLMGNTDEELIDEYLNQPE